MKEQSLTTLYNQLKDTLKHGVIYGLGETSAQLVGFLLIPLYTQYLSTTDYGVLALLTITGSLASAIFGLGIYSALVASYYDGSAESHEAVISTAFYIGLGSSIVLAVLGWVVAPFVSGLFFSTGTYSDYLRIVFLATSLEILSSLALAVYRARVWSKRYSIYNLLFVLIRLGLIIYFVAFLQQGVWGAVIGNCLASFAKMVLLYITIWKNLGLIFSPEEAKKLLAFGMPLTVSTLGGFVLHLSDRFLLNYYSPLAEVGIYNLGYQLGMVISLLLVTPLKLVWPPMVFSVREESYAREYYSKTLTYFCFIALLLSLIISVTSEDIIRIISTEAYWKSYKIVPIVCLSYTIWGINDLLSAEILLSRKTYYFAITTCTGAICNIILNILLIPSYGMMGAAVATLLSFLLVASMRYVIGQSLNRIRYEWYRVTKLILIWLVMYAVLSYLPIENMFIAVFVKSIFCLIYPLILLVVRFYDGQEREKAREYFRRIWQVTGTSQS